MMTARCLSTVNGIVVLLLYVCVPAVACTSGSRKMGCQGEGYGDFYEHGAVWNGTSCSSRSCAKGIISVMFCQEIYNRLGDRCRVTNSSIIGFPYCCPTPNLETCCSDFCFSFSARNKMTTGDKLTAPGCVLEECYYGMLYKTRCPHLEDQLEGVVCRRIEGKSNAEYPRCCPRVKCRKRCVDGSGNRRRPGKRWRNKDGQCRWCRLGPWNTVSNVPC